MSFFLKSYRFIYGLFLFLRYSRSLDLDTFLKGKRVAIIGAANSAFHANKGDYIDGFDLVIRINKAPLLLKEEKWKDDIGHKTDVLLHSFFENEKSGGGPLDLELFDRLGIKYLVNPIASYDGYRVTFNFYKKYLTKRNTYSYPRNSYRIIQSKLKGHKPTIGFCALEGVLQTDFSELYITGFTFFKTDFGEGYRDQIKEARQAQKFLKDAGLHNPDLEFQQFKKTLNKNRHKNIIIDNVLLEILRNES